MSFSPEAARRSIRALVRIETPARWNQRLNASEPGQLYGLDSAVSDPGKDLISVSISKGRNEPCGRFALTFVPRDVDRGRTWAELIPAYSLVTISLQAYPFDQAPVLVMLGLSDVCMQSEVYSSAEPQRQIQVVGRELSCLLADQRIVYLPVPPQDQWTQSAEPIADAAKRPPARQDAFGRVSPGEDQLPPTASEDLARQVSQQQGMYGIDPTLGAMGDTPVAVIDRFVRMLTVGVTSEWNKGGRPFVNLRFPDSQLRDLLFFDKSKAETALFDPRAKLPAMAQLSTNASMWQLLTTWSDSTYQELFPVTRDMALNTNAAFSSSRDAAIELIFRKKPFAGHIDETGKLTGVAPPSGTQFDEAFAKQHTSRIEDAEVASSSLSRGHLDQVSNIYWVYPMVSAMSTPNWNTIIHPLADVDPDSPSRISRFGPRLKHVSDRYMYLQDTLAPQEIATSRQALLRAWHRFEPEFIRGSYSLRGRADLQVGTRLVHEGRGVLREYYINRVAHHMLLGAEQPRFMTDVEVERGWDLG